VFDASDDSLKEGGGYPLCSDLDPDEAGRREVQFEV
jgi:hypothetical protein